MVGALASAAARGGRYLTLISALSGGHCSFSGLSDISSYPQLESPASTCQSLSDSCNPVAVAPRVMPSTVYVYFLVQDIKGLSAKRKEKCK